MPEQPKTPPAAGPNENAGKPLNPTRRRWLQAGLSAPPVLMTVVSRPVLAVQCVPPSAYVSLGASGVSYSECGGNGPKTWASAENWYGTGYCKTGDDIGCQGGPTGFNDIFNPPLSGTTPGSGPTLLQVLEGPNQVARYVVAALLNSGGTSPLVPANILGSATIKDIWSEFATSGVFTPIPGATWVEGEIIDYLSKTMITP